MKWYYRNQGSHTRVRVFMNGANCGELCFRVEEMERLKKELLGIVTMIDETIPNES